MLISVSGRQPARLRAESRLRAAPIRGYHDASIIFTAAALSESVRHGRSASYDISRVCYRSRREISFLYTRFIWLHTTPPLRLSALARLHFAYRFSILAAMPRPCHALAFHFGRASISRFFHSRHMFGGAMPIRAGLPATLHDLAPALIRRRSFLGRAAIAFSAASACSAPQPPMAFRLRDRFF